MRVMRAFDGMGWRGRTSQPCRVPVVLYGASPKRQKKFQMSTKWPAS